MDRRQPGLQPVHCHGNDGLPGQKCEDVSGSPDPERTRLARGRERLRPRPDRDDGRREVHPGEGLDAAVRDVSDLLLSSAEENVQPLARDWRARRERADDVCDKAQTVLDMWAAKLPPGVDVSKHWSGNNLAHAM